jgi:cytoskeletal protein CcmA (bactofilin family)
MLINRNLTVNNTIDNDVEVSNSAVLIIKGMVNGDISISQSARVEIYGMVNGNIRNAGTCVIWGMVNGSLIESGGRFDIKQGASISNVQF